MYRVALLVVGLSVAASAIPAQQNSPQHAHRRDGAHHAPAPQSAAPASSGYSAPATKHVAPVSNAIDTKAAPVPYQPQQQLGYYYYYYPINVKEEKSFYSKVKKFFEPLWYPWDTMMYYLGYGGDDSSDYDYDSTYSSYRSVSDSVSDYVPWDAIEEVGSVMTQDQCVEFYMCQLGTYARDYTNMHFMVELLAPHISDNSYYKSLANSALSEDDCFMKWSCPVIRRAPVGNEL